MVGLSRNDLALMCSNCASRSGWFEPSCDLRLNWREKPSLTSSLRTVSALTGWPIAVSASASLSMLLETHISGRMGSQGRRIDEPRKFGNEAGINLGDSPTPAPARRTCLGKRFRIQIVLAAIDRRAGKTRYPRHNGQTAPPTGSHLGCRKQPPPAFVELAPNGVPAVSKSRLRRSCTSRTPVRQSGIPAGQVIRHRRNSVIVASVLKRPLSRIAANAGADGDSIVAEAIRLPEGTGYNAAIGQFQDMFAAGVVDPVRVTSTALANAASVATLILTTETLVGDFTETEDPTAGPTRGGGAEKLAGRRGEGGERRRRYLPGVRPSAGVRGPEHPMPSVSLNTGYVLEPRTLTAPTPPSRAPKRAWRSRGTSGAHVPLDRHVAVLAPREQGYVRGRSPCRVEGECRRRDAGSRLRK